MHAMHEILDALNSARTIIFKMSLDRLQPFHRNFVTWQDHLGSSAYRWCGSENAAQFSGDVVGYNTLPGSEIREFGPMNFL